MKLIKFALAIIWLPFALYLGFIILGGSIRSLFNNWTEVIIVGVYLLGFSLGQRYEKSHK